MNWSNTLFEYNDRRWVKRYSTTPEVVEAAQVTKENMEDLAKWCGGEVRESHDEAVVPFLMIPTIAGALPARVGEWLLKNTYTNRLVVLSQRQFEAKKFHEVGLRQDGLTPRSPVIAINGPPPYVDEARTIPSWRGEE